jgi:hypothetical protein
VTDPARCWLLPAPAWVVKGKSFAGLGKGGATAIVLVGRDQSPPTAGPGICEDLLRTGGDEQSCKRQDWHRRRCDASPVLPCGHAAVGAVAGRAEGSAPAAGPESHSASLMPRMR